MCTAMHILINLVFLLVEDVYHTLNSSCIQLCQQGQLVGIFIEFTVAIYIVVAIYRTN